MVVFFVLVFFIFLIQLNALICCLPYRVFLWCLGVLIWVLFFSYLYSF